MYDASVAQDDPQLPDAKHPDACPVLRYEDPTVARLLSQYADYSEHGTLLRHPGVIEEQPNWWYESMQEIGAEWGRRRKEKMNNG